MASWIDECLIGNEGLPWNSLLIQLMHNKNFDNRVMKEAFHLLRIVSLLYNIGNFVNASVEVIGYVQHPHPSKVHEKPNLIGLKPR